MRIGFMSPFEPERIAFARRHGFGCVELMTPPGTDYLPPLDGWKDKAGGVKEAFDTAGIRISCVAGFYFNHMDPDQAEQFKQHTRAVIDLADHLGVATVAGFSGRVMGKPLEESVAPFKAIWSEHARYAQDRGIRIAFEHCPMGPCNLPPDGINCVCTPDMWQRCFDAVDSDALGLEWDPSHLVGLLIDPVVNLREWGHKAYHVHAKDAKIYHHILDSKGIYHHGVVEHCFPGLGDSDWGAIIKELYRAGYQGDVNIEGWHDAVFRDPQRRGQTGPALEDAGLLIAQRHLSQFVDGT
jgi:sugar phosphate isomerase/epimerase